MVHDPDAVADPLDVGEDVGREDDRGAGPQVGDQGEEVAPPLGVERADRLVEDEQARRGDQRLGDPEALAHPARVAADASPRGIGQPDQLERRGRLRAGVRGRQPLERAGQLDQLTALHPAVVARVLVEDADPAPGQRAIDADRPSVDRHVAARSDGRDRSPGGGSSSCRRRWARAARRPSPPARRGRGRRRPARRRRRRTASSARGTRPTTGASVTPPAARRRGRGSARTG